MNIVISDFVEGAKQARGTAVIIDVFRAFSTACYAFAAGATRIIPVAEPGEALALRKSLPGAVLIGERYGRKLEGFDLGNSPTELNHADLRGKTVIHTTHAGTQGLVNASQADIVLTGSLVNAGATARWILSTGTESVSLVRMGYEAASRTEEDDICAEYLGALLTSKSYDTANIEGRLRSSPCSRRFFDPDKPWSPPSDFEYCTRIDQFNFALKAVPFEMGLHEKT